MAQEGKEVEENAEEPFVDVVAVDGNSFIVVDCLAQKLRGLVKVFAFRDPPQFVLDRVQIESAEDLWPLIVGTRDLYLNGVGEEAVVVEERGFVAAWLQKKLQPQFAFPIEVTSESASHHGKVLARFAGAEEPSKSWQRFYSTFHIDHKQNTASIEEGVQVNVWLNLAEEPISDFNLGFLAKGEHMISGQDLPQLDHLGDIRVRYQANLRRDQALIFQSTGANAVVHGCFRFQDAEKLTNSPRYSLEFRVLLRRVGASEE